MESGWEMPEPYTGGVPPTTSASQRPNADVWHLWECALFLFAVLGLQFTLAILIDGLLPPPGSFRDLEELLHWRQTLYLMAGPGSFLLLLLVHRRRGGAKAIWRWRELTSAKGLALIGAALAVSVAANVVNVWIQTGQNPLLLPWTGGLRTDVGVPWDRVLIVGVAAMLVAPVAEEWFFRGILLPALDARLYRGLGVVLSALAFMLFHDPSNWGVVVVYGLTWATLSQSRQSVTRSLVVHMAVNSLVVLLGVL